MRKQAGFWFGEVGCGEAGGGGRWGGGSKEQWGGQDDADSGYPHLPDALLEMH